MFTLDTAFQRRWEMQMVKSNIDNVRHAKQNISGTKISWGNFITVTNDEITRMTEEFGSVADKRLGAYFLKESELGRKEFSEKVLKYLWDDAFKLDHSVYFNDEITSLERIIDIFQDKAKEEDPLAQILRCSIYAKMLGDKPVDIEPSDNVGENE
ncbi:MAG: hypothetical protein E7277_08765 [Lachnospiraceae bacterium]|nr:hypothetical protein [Lachnospiraceae bacterium]